jgi:hypothetical protein
LTQGVSRRGPYLVPPVASPSALYELRPAALGERHGDEVEVARHDCPWEELARLRLDLGAAVAGREMREREKLDAGLPRHERCFTGSRVTRLLGARTFVRQERRLVDEHVGAGRRFDHGRGRCRVAGEGDRAPAALGADHLVGTDDAPAGERHRLASL